MPIRNFAKAAYLAVVGILLLAALAMFVWGQVSSWRAGTWEDRARQASAAATTAQANASSANAGAANATATREAIDFGSVTVRVETEQSARRIQDHDPNHTEPAGAPDADVLRELEDASRKYRAAADRLQRARTR